MATCKYPNCTVDLAAHRPYANKRDGVPSVTTISGLIDDGKSRSFGWAASLIAATTAVHEAERWSHLGWEGCTHEKDGLCPSCRFLRSEFDRQWSAKADRGTHVHHLALSWAEGEDVDEDATTKPYLDALAAFYEECKPEWVELERTVFYDKSASHAYRGQFDFIATLTIDGERRTMLGDIKTGGFYPAEQSLQLAAYRYANHLTTWEDKKEVLGKPVPVVSGAGVLLLSDEGTYQWRELPANGDAHGTFLRLRDAWAWNRQMGQWAKEQDKQTVTQGEAA